MASGSKTTAVHFTLIFFVMLSVILSVVSYMYYDEEKALRATAAKAIADATTDKNAYTKNQKDINDLKRMFGYPQPEVADIAEAVKNDQSKYGGSFAQPTLAATIVKLSQQVDTLTKERDGLTVELQKHKDQIASLRLPYAAQVTAQTGAAQKAEKDRSTEQANREEAIATKNEDIDRLRKNINKVQVEREQERDQHVAELAQLNQKIALLIAINIKHVEELKKVRFQSFEHQDGLIRWVDSVNKLVWINLGTADKLPKGMTFSVYTKGNSGVGRGTHDIKASIEVARLLQPHLAECKIVDDNVYEPLAPGDPIYTPLWSRGVKERFSFVGWIDLDGDGKHELDRKQLHHIVTSAGAEIGGEVDDEGNFTGNDIDVHTKYLVVGHIPVPDDFVKVENQEIATAIQEQLKRMKEQARERGVDVISLKKFTAYMGYKPSRRLWLPGEDVPWLLKSGSRSTAVNETIGKRQSSGTNSSLFTKGKRLKKPKPSGKVSNLYK